MGAHTITSARGLPARISSSTVAISSSVGCRKLLTLMSGREAAKAWTTGSKRSRDEA